MSETKPKTIYQKIATIQATIGAIEKDKTNPAFRGAKYFDVNTLAAALMPLLREQGILLTMPLQVVGDRTVIALVLHDLQGEEMHQVAQAYLPDNVTIQQLGGAITYLRRYLPVSYFYLQAEDDDGNLASAPVSRPAARPGFTPSGAPNAETKRSEAFQKASNGVDEGYKVELMDEDEFLG